MTVITRRLLHDALRTSMALLVDPTRAVSGRGCASASTVRGGGAEGALAAATAIQGALRPLGLAVRVGLHTGDCYVVDDKCTGLAIHICARIVSLAEPGEVLVSESVREEAGPRFAFVGRGTRALRGIPGEWRLFALVGGS
jgi:class 3 adenylate cyclase